jgi:nitric oxide reductase subunit B
MGNIPQASISANLNSDPVSNVLKWILLFTAIACFIVLVWGTYKTYQLAPHCHNNFYLLQDK